MRVIAPFRPPFVATRRPTAQSFALCSCCPCADGAGSISTPQKHHFAIIQLRSIQGLYFESAGIAILHVRSESEQAAVAILHYELSRLSRRDAKFPGELHAAACELSMQCVDI